MIYFLTQFGSRMCISWAGISWPDAQDIQYIEALRVTWGENFDFEYENDAFW